MATVVTYHLQTGWRRQDQQISDDAGEAWPTSHVTGTFDQSRRRLAVTSSAGHASPPAAWSQCSSREAGVVLPPDLTQTAGAGLLYNHIQ